MFSPCSLIFPRYSIGVSAGSSPNLRVGGDDVVQPSTMEERGYGPCDTSGTVSVHRMAPSSCQTAPRWIPAGSESLAQTTLPHLPQFSLKFTASQIPSVGLRGELPDGCPVLEEGDRIPA